MAKKYIPNKSWLTCDKGEMPTQITVTHNNRASIYGEELASEADVIPGENILPFGKCSITGNPCAFAPIYWDKCNKGVKVNGFKLVFDDAKLLCQQGGKIKVDFDVPYGSILIGGGYGLLNIVPNISNMANVDAIMSIDNLKWSQIYGKGTFSDGRSLSSLVNKITRMGSNPYTQMPPLKVVQMSDGSITSLDHRRGIAAIEAGANEVPVSIKKGSDLIPPDEAIQYKVTKSEQAKILGVEKDAIPKTYEEAVKYRSAGQGKKFPVEGSSTKPYAKNPSLKPPSKANKLIGKVTQSISDTKFSQGIRNSSQAMKANAFLAQNADQIAKVGKVVGKGAVVVGIAIDAFMIGSAYNEEGKFGDKTQQATGSAVGGAAGAWAGAELGAIIGTAICPGIGTVIGGVIGAIGGGLIGSGAGSALVDWMF